VIRFKYLLSLPAGFLAEAGTKLPHPLTKYWIAIRITLEVTQYRARPLGNVKAKKANIIGIIHSIIWLCDRCLGSAVDGVTIFCCSHIVPPTKMARIILPVARFNQRNSLFKGTIEYTTGQE